jgi:hypothetical protein
MSMTRRVLMLVLLVLLVSGCRLFDGDGRQEIAVVRLTSIQTVDLSSDARLIFNDQREYWLQPGSQSVLIEDGGIKFQAVYSAADSDWGSVVLSFRLDPSDGFDPEYLHGIAVSSHEDAITIRDSHGQERIIVGYEMSPEDWRNPPPWSPYREPF